MAFHISLMAVGLLAIGLFAYLSYQISSIAFILTILTAIFSLLITFILTKRWLDDEHEVKIEVINDKFGRKIRRLKKEHDTTTLERTIRDGTRTLIKNALDYFKLENIKNEMGATAAIQNLQLDKYGQIIELLADFSLILPDIKENQEIVEQEIHHQIEIYEVDEKPFALFLSRIMDKYAITVQKKIREKVEQNLHETMKVCPRCAEKVLRKAHVCKHCGYEFKGVSKSPTDNTIALDRVEKGKELFRSGNFQGALDALNSAVELKPDYAVAYYNRAIVFNKLGDRKNAEKDLKEASYLGHKKAQELLKLKDMAELKSA